MKKISYKINKTKIIEIKIPIKEFLNIDIPQYLSSDWIPYLRVKLLEEKCIKKGVVLIKILKGWGEKDKKGKDVICFFVHGREIKKKKREGRDEETKERRARRKRAD